MPVDLPPYVEQLQAMVQDPNIPCAYYATHNAVVCFLPDGVRFQHRPPDQDKNAPPTPPAAPPEAPDHFQPNL